METLRDTTWNGRQIWRDGDFFYVEVSPDEFTGAPARLPANLPRAIGLIGEIGGGKSTVARMLESAHNGSYSHAHLADALKESILRTLAPLGVERRHLFGTQADKAEPIPTLGGATGRQLAVKVGTGGYRAAYADVWVDLLMKRYVNRLAIGDVRFTNEIRAIRAAGGQIWRVRVQGEPPGDATDQTEREWRECEPEVELVARRGNLEVLWAQVQGALGVPRVAYSTERE